MRLDDENLDPARGMECKHELPKNSLLSIERWLRAERERAFFAACEAFGHRNDVENYRKFFEFEEQSNVSDRSR